MSLREELIGEDKVSSSLFCFRLLEFPNHLCILHHVLSAGTVIPTLFFNRHSPRKGCSHSIGEEGCFHSTGGGIFFPDLATLYEGPVTILGHQSCHTARLALSRGQEAKPPGLVLSIPHTGKRPQTLPHPASTFHSGELFS